jgi:peptidoglycan hydrolase-like protein with peptidoglycan-binding domain
MNQLSLLEEVLRMVSTQRIRARQRRRIGHYAFVGAILSLTPALVFDGTVAAQGAVTAVTGLRQGSQGDAVRAVQQALVNQGVSLAGGVDGVFGAGTASALKQFQARSGLNATGVVDDATAIALGLMSNPYHGLKQGSNGDAVRQLQQRLIDLGIAVNGGADGVFGPGTAAAVKQFQASKGYAKTGAVNAATAAALGASSAAPAPAAPAPASPAPAASGLEMGARGDVVKQLQQQLIAAGFSMVGGADGIFGALTANALGSFQQSVGLPASRVADEATLAALTQAAANSGASSAASSPLLGLESGARSDAVKQLQQALINAGVTVRGGADGIFGWNTMTAVKRFQEAVGLPATGAVDAATANALASGRTIAGGQSGLVGLKAGSLGSQVKALQEALIKVGVNVRGGADGIFGPATAQALRSFQQSQGLEPTGVVDDATVGALQNPKAPVTSPSGTGPDGYPVYGERGQRVLKLQAALVNAGISVRGGVDGDFGAGTAAAVMDFQRAKGLNVTGKVNEATASALGLAKAPAPSAPDPAAVNFSVFPVQGFCQFGDSFGYSRSGGRVHLGIDIIAAAGKLVYAVADGKITKIYYDYPGSLSGNGVQLTTADGTYYFYAHMTGTALGIEVGARVKAGQILGTVGSTGSSTANHLHFEAHPRGGSAVNPYQHLKSIDGCKVTAPLPQP